MSATWYGDAASPRPRALTWLDWLRASLKGCALAIWVFGGLVVLLIARIFERPLCGTTRPVTPWITVVVCRGALKLVGLRQTVIGDVALTARAVVANHASWLDIFVLNSVAPVYFVSKSEVAGWPGIGWLARATGTVFIARDPAQAMQQRDVFLQRLAAGHRLLFFPEGTSSDGQRVLGFKSTLFAALIDPDLGPMTIQPVSVRYFSPRGTDTRFYGWWGDMEFGAHLLQVLAFGAGGSVVVNCQQPIALEGAINRKDLAKHCEALVRRDFEAAGVARETDV